MIFEKSYSNYFYIFLGEKNLIAKCIENILMLFSIDNCGHIVDSDWFDNEFNVILVIVVGSG